MTLADKNSGRFALLRRDEFQIEYANYTIYMFGVGLRSVRFEVAAALTTSTTTTTTANVMQIYD